MTEKLMPEEELKINQSIENSLQKKEMNALSKEEGEEKKPEKKVRTPEEKKAFRNKLIKTSLIIFVIIMLSIGAFFIGPKNMEPGEYTVQLYFNINEQQYQPAFTITMAEKTNAESVEYIIPLNGNGNSCIIFSSQAFQASTNSKIFFKVGLLDSSNESIQSLKLTDVTGEIVGQDISRKIRPTRILTVHSTTLDTNVETVYFEMAVPYKAGIAMILLVVIAALWITEIVPTIVGSFLVPIIVTISGISSASSALQPFFHPVIALFFGGFVMAEALKKHKIDRRLALSIVGRASIKPSVLLLVMIGVTAFLSMWMSNTASAAIMIPIALAMIEQIKVESEGFKKALVLGIGYAATTGGIASVIGTPANPIAVAALEGAGIQISFLKWFGYGLPIVILLLLVIWGYLLLIFRPKVPKENIEKAKIVFKEDLKKMGKMGKREWLTVGTFVVTIALWLTQELHNINSGIIALIAVVVLFAVNILKVQDLKNLNWNSLFLFGGGLCLGDALIATGIGDWIASKMGIIEGKHIIIVALIVGGITLLVTGVASNTASAAMIIPLVIPIAISLQWDPVLLAAIAAIGSSVDYALVFGTPPTMISYSTGYFKVREIFRIGIVLDIIGIALLSTVSVLLWVAFGLVTI